MDNNQKEINVLFKSVFANEQGEKMLKYLNEVFVDRDIYKNGLTLDQVAFRQGEASIVKKIEQEINRRFD